MSDANVAVNFSASVGDLVSGLAGVRDAFGALSGPVGELNQRFSDNADIVRAAREEISEEIRSQQEALRERLSQYNDDARNSRITQQQKLAFTQEALEQELAAKLALLREEDAIGGQSLAQHMRIQGQILAAEQTTQYKIADLTRQAVDAQQQQYDQLGSTLTRAFNSQLRGLLSGTENWRGAFKKILEDLLIDFIQWGEAQVVRSIAIEAAKTSAVASGVAARTGAEAAGASTSLAVQGAAMIRSILSSSAEAFAGVFGFLSPVMGPFAAGPAAAAQATVAGMAGAVASADIGMWSVPKDMLTLVHHNELIMPAAQAGAFRDMLSGDGGAGGSRAVHVHPTTNFHVSAIDSGSVSQWMRQNSSGMVKAIDEAVRHGAHLGARRLTSR